MSRRSLNKVYKPFVIISAELSNRCCQYENDAASFCLENDLRGLGFTPKRLEGYYKGVRETSFYVEYNGLSELTALIELRIKYDQESILDVTEERHATLRYNDKLIKIGKFKQVCKEVAEQCDSYTYDYTNGGYYICE